MSFRCKAGIGLLLLLGLFAGSSIPATAQDDAPQAPVDDLSAAAKKAKADRQTQQNSGATTSDAIKQMANEIAEGPDAVIGPVPVGYRTYVAEGRDYALFVPQFAQIESRDGRGLKLASTNALDTRTVVILGAAIPVKGDSPKDMLGEAVDAYFGCDLGRWVTVADLNGHSMAKVNHQSCWKDIVGYSEFILGDGYVIPVVCGYPYNQQEWAPDPRINWDPKARKAAIDRDNESRNGMRACDTILPSFHFLPHGVSAKLKPVSTAPKQAVVTAALASGSTEDLSATAMQENSLGAVARAHKKPRTAAVIEDLKHVPSGFTNFDFRYCNKDDCHDASILMPAKAERNNNYGNYPVGLFQYTAPLKDAQITIEAVTAGPSESGWATPAQVLASQYHIEDYQTNAEQKSGSPSYEILGDQKTTINDMPARWHTIRSHNAVENFLTQQIEYMAPGMFVVIRCKTLERLAAEAHDVCSTVVQSFTIPQPKDQADDPSSDPSDDPPPQDLPSRDDDPPTKETNE
jgi:hypothetical protein